MTSSLDDPRLEKILEGLHQKSDAQDTETNAAFEKKEQQVPIEADALSYLPISKFSWFERH